MSPILAILTIALKFPPGNVLVTVNKLQYIHVKIIHLGCLEYIFFLIKYML